LMLKDEIEGRRARAEREATVKVVKKKEATRVPVHIEPVVKKPAPVSHREEKERQVPLFDAPVEGSLPPLALLGCFAQRSRHRRHEPLETALQHVIGRARFHAFDRFVLAQRAGDDDDRRIRLGFARERERLQSVVGGEVVVAEHEIEGIARDRRFERRPVARANDLARAPFGLERVLDELRVERVVFEMQDSAGRRRFQWELLLSLVLCGHCRH